MICKECGKEKIWMEYTECWTCPNDCTGEYALRSSLALGMNLSSNPKYKGKKMVSDDYVPTSLVVLVRKSINNGGERK